jgi:exonuclease I
MQAFSQFEILSSIAGKSTYYNQNSLKLGDLIEFEEAHDALNDVRATVRLAKALTEDFRKLMI